MLRKSSRINKYIFNPLTARVGYIRQFFSCALINSFIYILPTTYWARVMGYSYIFNSLAGRIGYIRQFYGAYFRLSNDKSGDQ
jgi:hypothetical protein